MVGRSVRWFVGRPLVSRSVGWLIGWSLVVRGLVVWLVGWLDGWIVGWFGDWPVGHFVSRTCNRYKTRSRRFRPPTTVPLLVENDILLFLFIIFKLIFTYLFQLVKEQATWLDFSRC